MPCVPQVKRAFFGSLQKMNQKFQAGLKSPGHLMSARSVKKNVVFVGIALVSTRLHRVLILPSPFAPFVVNSFPNFLPFKTIYMSLRQTPRNRNPKSTLKTQGKTPFHLQLCSHHLSENNSKPRYPGEHLAGLRDVCPIKGTLVNTQKPF